MANQKIEDLPKVTEVGATDFIVMQQGGRAKNLTGDVLVDYCKNNTAQVYAGDTAPTTGPRIWINDNADTDAGVTLVGRIEGDTLILEESKGPVISFKDRQGNWRGLPNTSTKGTGIASITFDHKNPDNPLEDVYKITYTDTLEPTFFTVTSGGGQVDSVNGKVDRNVVLTPFDFTLHAAKKVGHLDDPLTSPNLHVVLIGDSYLNGETFNSPNVNSWGYYLRQYAGGNEANYHLYPQSKSGFIGDGTVPTFRTLLSNATGTLSEEVRNNTALLVVGGGWNDKLSTEAAIKNAVISFCNDAKINFPNARIIVSCMGTHMNCSDRNKVIRAYRDGALESGCECYCDNWESLHGNTGLISEDNCHPTLAGYQEIAKWLYAYIRGNAFNPNHVDDFMSKIRYTVGAVGGSYFKRVGNMVHFNYVAGPLKFPQTPQTLFTIPEGYCPYYPGANPKTHWFPCTVAGSADNRTAGAVAVYETGKVQYEFGGTTSDDGFLFVSGSYEIGG